MPQIAPSRTPLLAVVVSEEPTHSERQWERYCQMLCTAI